MSIKCGERIVKDLDVRVGVNQTANANPLFLTPRKRDSFLADFGEITIWENGKIREKT